MSQRETFQKIRDMETQGAPETQLLAEAIGAFQDQLSRVVNDVMKLKNDIQALKNVRVRAH